MTLRTIRLELARCADFPAGSAAHGYEFTAPLDADHRFDESEWKRARERCKVRRFWGGQPEEEGLLICTKRGRWAFSYVPDTAEDDEPIFKFDRHVLKPGEYISVTEHDGVERTFRVAYVR